MIYTVGSRDAYRAGLYTFRENFRKLGKIEPGGYNEESGEHFPEGYQGGGVWQTREEAQTYCDTHEHLGGLVVWSLDADWEKDTYACEATHNPAGLTRYLLNTSRLVREIPKEAPYA